MKIKRKRAELSGVGPRYTIRQSEPTNWDLFSFHLRFSKNQLPDLEPVRHTGAGDVGVRDVRENDCQSRDCDGKQI